MKAYHLSIFGDVTGVGFRAWMKVEADKRGIVGWVKNLDRGIVQAEVYGEDASVEKMVEACHKGPEISWVEKVQKDSISPSSIYTSFEIIS